jgi:hypothetical protein
MSLPRPLRRTCRPFVNGSYTSDGHWRYLIHPRFANDPQHYVRGFLLLQRDLISLFDYIEPADSNLKTYSHRVQQLLMRTCVEIEANFTAVLTEHGYKTKSADLSMKDYRLTNKSHHLSAYEVRLPGWRGDQGIRKPFAAWVSPEGGLKWYQAYNKSKHDRHNCFHLATFEALVDAIAGLAVLMSAQFHQEDYAPGPKSIAVTGAYSYEADDGMESSVGEFFRVRFPTDWTEAEAYSFDWEQLSHEADPFSCFNYEAGA